ncbi:MAG TPA: tRNA lysidine(34) synthetase TilS [Syntrophorhabdaceae bacterium]|nr:tRNA lysidine(34) synthetase TilS [Syntrophorhabdaceae bacterium]HQM81399.1 tRNA lysidine(34) synthetase TilS [Syntrophorhabdaceae bacterium]
MTRASQRRTRNNSLVKKIKKIIEKEGLIREGDNVLLGASGGIDSTALLHVLLNISGQITFSLGLAHVNHRLRGSESQRDEDFVKDLARRFSLPLYTKKVNVKEFASASGISLQHAGRELRYAFFNDTAKGHNYNKIAIAHTLDDQVETFLLRIIKGTGIRGLSSIPVRRGLIIRPFLFTYKSEIEEYARQNGVSFVDDSSNEKVIYERNFLRKKIIPVMEELNPAVKEKIFSLLQDITAINLLFDDRSKAFLLKEKEGLGEESVFDAAALANTDEETRFRVLSDTLASIEPRFIPLRQHIFSIERIIKAKKPNLTVILPYGLKAKKVYKSLIFTKKSLLPPVTDQIPLTTGKNILKSFNIALTVSTQKRPSAMTLENHNVAFFDRQKTGDLSVRTFRPGDRFFPLGMKNHVKLKDFFISRKVPREERRLIPLLISGNDIIWIIGHRIDERYKVTEMTRETLKVTVSPL